MIIEAIAFYLFSAVAILSGVLVVANRNPVYSVLFLILAFFNAAGLFVLLGAEFLAMMLVVVYVGAVAVLFLFVVMMLDINYAELREGFVRYLPVGALIGVVLVVELVIAFLGWTAPAGQDQVLPAAAAVSNTSALGSVLYTNYFFAFQGAGLILLVAMIGAIVLTHRSRQGVKRQRIAEQVARGPESVVLKKVPTGSGI